MPRRESSCTRGRVSFFSLVLLFSPFLGFGCSGGSGGDDGQAGCPAPVGPAGDVVPYPMKTADEYWAQYDAGRLTSDVEAHWAFGLTLTGTIDYSQVPYFGMPDPYDMGMYRDWTAQNMSLLLSPGSIYPLFSGDTEHGWPASMQGIAWVYAAMGWAWAAPSVAMIDPQRTAEAAYTIESMIKLYRSPATWIDYVVYVGTLDPMIDNVMWKGPLLMAEGLWALVTGDRETYRPEMTAIARNLYDLQAQAVSLPYGQGHSGGVACEPDQWFPQCNSWGAMGLLLYDRVYGVDQERGVLLGEEYRRHYMDYLRSYMLDPASGLVYRYSHPAGPLVIERTVSANANVFASITGSYIDRGFWEDNWNRLRASYIKDDPCGHGAFMIDHISQTPINRAIDEASVFPTMGGEADMNVFLAPAAARTYDDRETFEKLHRYLNAYVPASYYAGEMRFDLLNTDDPEESLGRLLNMASGWWLYFKVHLGWEAILAHDWSQHRDANGLLLGASWPPSGPRGRR